MSKSAIIPNKQIGSNHMKIFGTILFTSHAQRRPQDTAALKVSISQEVNPGALASGLGVFGSEVISLRHAIRQPKLRPAETDSGLLIPRWPISPRVLLDDKAARSHIYLLT